MASTSARGTLGDCAVLRAWREACAELCQLWDESKPVTAWAGVTFGAGGADDVWGAGWGEGRLRYEAGGLDAGRVVEISLHTQDLTAGAHTRPLFSST